ncbi:hypothetical protein RFI_02323 [Reticulomyxa filosa]|uniref:DUS-like FMN-binding domain-containing protein n=1 Tax=Reticulomyxa filosa TaxID=46433 RepID=X6P9B4_RETFI|nr:hypothetical protein RFI_02323 [Reticulomyxa filosa]|eukprot:ETO34766.1 hypothetical protein RFI_02323 [Reticulomyxa filosa]
MGAALLQKPELVKDILTALVRNFGSQLTITAKVRLLEDEKKTLELCQMIENTGVNALTIHARYTADRPRIPARVGLIKTIVDKLTIPVIYNGDVFSYQDIEVAKKMTGCHSVMIARGAQWNPSIFRSPEKGGMVPLCEVMREYVEIAEKYGNRFGNTKYVCIKMLTGRKYWCKTDINTKFQVSKSYEDLHRGLKQLTTEQMQMHIRNSNRNNLQDLNADIVKSALSNDTTSTQWFDNKTLENDIQDYCDQSVFRSN